MNNSIGRVEDSLKILPPRLILLGLNSVLSENIAGNIISYSNLRRIVEIDWEKNARLTSHFGLREGTALLTPLCALTRCRLVLEMGALYRRYSDQTRSLGDCLRT